MTKLQCFEKSLEQLLNEKADHLSFSTKLIKRRRKIKGSSFAKAMIIDFLHNLKILVPSYKYQLLG